jgi:pimeloyl-ACP methyl ester carboxylesterase
LEKIGAPPFASDVQFRTLLKWSTAYEAGAPSNLKVLSWVLLAPRYGLGDVRNWVSGFLASQGQFFGKTMRGPVMAVDLPSRGTDFAVPMFFFHGTEDDRTPFALVRAYFEAIRAPQKMLVPVAGAGHYVEDTHPQDLRKLLDDHVRPLGVQAGRTGK